MPPFTRTHTHYFAEENLEPLRSAYATLRDDWEGRRPYIDHGARHSGDARLELLRHAIGLLGEPVVE